MKAFLLGLLLGCALGAVVFFTFADRNEMRQREPVDTLEQREKIAEAAPVEADTRPARVREALPAAASRRFSRGTAKLRVGEGCDLATGEILTGDSARRADVIVADIQGDGVTIECPFGCIEPILPAILIGERPSMEECFDRPLDAPPELPLKLTTLIGQTHPPVTGLALVGNERREAFKVRMVEVTSSPRVLDRTATIRYAPVPTKPDGGRVRLEGQLEPAKLDQVSQEALRRMLKRPALPGDSFKSHAGDAFAGVASLPENFELPASAHLGLTEPFQSAVTISKGGSLYLSKGVGKRGKAKLDSYSGLLIEGDMDGEIDVNSYAYVHITGSLNGTLTCKSYTTVIVDGNVNGVLRIRSYVTLYLGGRFAEPATCLDAESGNHCTFFFHSYTTRTELERFQVSSSYKLHVRQSDLADGPHEGVGRWGTVTVADPLWQTLL